MVRLNIGSPTGLRETPEMGDIALTLACNQAYYRVVSYLALPFIPDRAGWCD